MLPRPVYIAFRIVVPLLIIVVGVAGFIALASLRKPPVRSETEEALPLVETVPVEAHTGELTIHADGAVVPFREAPLSAEVAGRITWRSPKCRAGHFVEKDEILFRINQHEYELEVDRLTHEQEQANASLRELQVQIESAEALARLATDELALRTRELERVRRLASQNAASDADIDQAEQNEQVARRTLVQQQNMLRLEQTRRVRLESALALVGTQLEKAQFDLDRTEVKSPVSGVVVAEPVEADSYVQRGTLLVTIEDTSSVEVRCSLKMDEVHWLWQHDSGIGAEGDSPAATVGLGAELLAKRGVPQVPVTVSYELAGQKFAWVGHLSRYDGAGLDPKTRMVPCRVLVDRPADVSRRSTEGGAAVVAPPALLRGMYVALDFHAQPKVPLLKVPDSAIRPGDVLWLVRDGKLERHEVSIAQTTRGVALIPAIDSGLTDTDQVVVSPLSTEVSGQQVRTNTTSGEVMAEQRDGEAQP